MNRKQSLINRKKWLMPLWSAVMVEELRELMAEGIRRRLPRQSLIMTLRLGACTRWILMNQCHTQPAINGAAAVGCHSGGTKDSALNAAAVAAADAVIPLVEDGPMVGLLSLTGRGK
jgi:hypothetical protein